MHLLPQRQAGGLSSYLLTLLTTTTLTHAISLSSFNPVVTSPLPSTCSDLYNDNIPGCAQSDFISGNPCSTMCTEALVALAPMIQSACANVDLSGTPNNILSAFMNGDGVSDLCPNVVVTTVTSMSSTPTSTSSMMSFSNSQGLMTASSSNPATSISASIGTSSVTSTRPTFAPTTFSSAPAAMTSKSDDGSGGGSPFSPQTENAGSVAVTAPWALVMTLTGSLLILLR